MKLLTLLMALSIVYPLAIHAKNGPDPVAIDLYARLGVVEPEGAVFVHGGQEFLLNRYQNDPEAREAINEASSLLANEQMRAFYDRYRPWINNHLYLKKDSSYEGFAGYKGVQWPIFVIAGFYISLNSALEARVENGETRGEALFDVIKQAKTDFQIYRDLFFGGLLDKLPNVEWLQGDEEFRELRRNGYFAGAVDFASQVLMLENWRAALELDVRKATGIFGSTYGKIHSGGLSTNMNMNILHFINAILHFRLDGVPVSYEALELTYDSRSRSSEEKRDFVLLREDASLRVLVLRDFVFLDAQSRVEFLLTLEPVLEPLIEGYRRDTSRYYFPIQENLKNGFALAGLMLDDLEAKEQFEKRTRAWFDGLLNKYFPVDVSVESLGLDLRAAVDQRFAQPPLVLSPSARLDARDAIKQAIDTELAAHAKVDERILEARRNLTRYFEGALEQFRNPPNLTFRPEVYEVISHIYGSLGVREMIAGIDTSRPRQNGSSFGRLCISFVK